MVTGTAKHANIVGLGLIGGSLSLALQREGFVVHGTDSNPERESIAVERGIISDCRLERSAAVGFVATPVAQTAESVRKLLSEMDGFVSDVGSTKGHIANEINDARFVPGHPMAGSELDGLDGADGSMFERAVWVLTPTANTRDDAFESVAELVKNLGADVVTLSPDQHDRLVAIISHVPHLAATSLMRLAADRSEEHLALLRLAAGGFRDMTRIASGRPDIWIDICAQNRVAILEALDGLMSRLGEVREMVSEGQSNLLMAHLESARRSRLNLPTRLDASTELSEIRIPISDRPGAAAEVFGLAAQLGTNVLDFEVVHSAEGASGVLVAVIASDHAELFRGGLMARGFRPAVQRIS